MPCCSLAKNASESFLRLAFFAQIFGAGTSQVCLSSIPSRSCGRAAGSAAAADLPYSVLGRLGPSLTGFRGSGRQPATGLVRTTGPGSTSCGRAHARSCAGSARLRVDMSTNLTVQPEIILSSTFSNLQLRATRSKSTCVKLRGWV